MGGGWGGLSKLGRKRRVEREENKLGLVEKHHAFSFSYFHFIWYIPTIQ